MGWTVRGSNRGRGENFRTCPDRPWGPPSLLYNGFRVFPGGKERPGRDANPSPPSSAVGHERVELYLYSPCGTYGLYRASVSVRGCTLLTPWSRVLLEKLTVNFAASQEFPRVYGTRKFFYGCVMLPLETLLPVIRMGE
jgi:hypothetical protein